MYIVVVDDKYYQEDTFCRTFDSKQKAEQWIKERQESKWDKLEATVYLAKVESKKEYDIEWVERKDDPDLADPVAIVGEELING